jgi:hypothetical protein
MEVIENERNKNEIYKTLMQENQVIARALISASVNEGSLFWYLKHGISSAKIIEYWVDTFLKYSLSKRSKLVFEMLDDQLNFKETIINNFDSKKVLQVFESIINNNKCFPSHILLCSEEDGLALEFRPMENGLKLTPFDDIIKDETKLKLFHINKNIGTMRCDIHFKKVNLQALIEFFCEFHLESCVDSEFANIAFHPNEKNMLSPLEVDLTGILKVEKYG